ncbi:MAG: hypothetical protein V1646_00195 [bacterium]
MIDTVILILDSENFQIIEPDKFDPSASWILSNKSIAGKNGYIFAKQNPTKKEFRAGIYKPRLTLTKRCFQAGFVITLKIECSLTKLLYGNNFDELEGNDFMAVAEKLKTKLGDMGIKVSPESLANAKIHAIHYSKNIHLTDGMIPAHFISRIRNSDISKILDMSEKDFRNGGHCFKMHCNSYEVVFYDKIQDLKAANKSDKRTIESDNVVQLGILNDLQKRYMLEVLRFEVRLNSTKKIKQLFQLLKISAELKFKELFSESVSQCVLQHYMHEVESSIPPNFDYKKTDTTLLLTALAINNPNMNSKKVLQKFGLIIALDNMNQRELRVLFGKCSQRSWDKEIQELKLLNLPRKTDSFEIIHKQLSEFKPLRLSNFKCDK